MKIIFSRKGFDSAAGGFASPIIDNKLVSLPIPDKDEEKRYSDLWDNDKNYYQIMKELIYGDLLLENKKIKLNEQTKCHLDPYIDVDILKDRSKKWKAIFGQIGTAQEHLENQSVQVGDIFLFFGWFKNTKITKETKRLMYFGDDKHIIWSYFQIGDIIKVNDKPKEYWRDWAYHPHIKNKKWLSEENNTIYIAKEKLTFNSELPGAGKFNYNSKLVLTKNGHPRTHWGLPKIFKNKEISYHNNDTWIKDSKTGEEYFKSASRGQEFVVEGDKEIKEWMIELINKCANLK